MASVLSYLRELNIVTMMLRILLAVLCGGLIGLERERKNRPAGFRTYMLTALGATLTVLLSLQLDQMLHGPWRALAESIGATQDVSRFGAEAAKGIGFLGAGTIIITARQQVKGLTTAAGLWASACLGLAIGAVTPAEIAVSICAQLVEHRRALPETEYPGTLLEQTNSDLSAIRYLAENAEPKALLLVLTSTGSTPVKSGALMAVNKLGTGCGTIGGGCSEAAAMQRARKIIGTGGSCVIEIDMTNDVAADEGMVCGGTMRVLIEDASENKT